MNRRKFLASTLSAGLGGHFLLSGSHAHATENFHQPPVFPTNTYFEPGLASNSTEPVGMCVVIGLDISKSIDTKTNEYRNQINAVAESFENNDLREAIFSNGGPGSLSVFVVDYNDRSKLQIGGVDFRENHPAKFYDFAQRIRAIKRRADYGGTNHAAVMENASYCFTEGDKLWPSRKKYVNILTDGEAAGVGTNEKNHEWIRILARDYGASVSGLLTSTSTYPEIRNWSLEHLCTPAGLKGPGGREVPKGIARIVATEAQTQGTEVLRYKDQVHQVFRNQIILQALYEAFDKKRQFAGYIPELGMPSRRSLFTIPETLRI